MKKNKVNATKESWTKIVDAKYGLNTYEYCGMMFCAAVEAVYQDIKSAEKLSDEIGNKIKVQEMSFEDFMKMLKEVTEDVD